MLRARESGVPVDGVTYTIRRPTDYDMVVMENANGMEFIKKFVVGWELTEAAFDPGGGPERVPFDADLWATYVTDHPELWGPLGMAIKDSYQKHAAALETDPKN